MYSECIMNSASDGAERALTQCNAGLVFFVWLTVGMIERKGSGGLI